MPRPSNRTHQVLNPCIDALLWALVPAVACAAEDSAPPQPAQASAPSSGPGSAPAASPVPAATADDQADFELGTIVVNGKGDEPRSDVSTSLGTGDYRIDSQQLEDESGGANASFSHILLRAPGVVQDSYGQVHVRGEHANLQYRVNDVLLPTGVIGFGQQIDPRFIGNLQFITGALPAEYGLQTSGVVDIQTKNGSFQQGGDVSLYGGSYDTLHPSVDAGGTWGKIDYYLSGGFQHTSLGIENPTPSRTPLHDDSNQGNAFAYGSYALDDEDHVSLILSGSAQTFEIPNVPNQAQVYALAGTPSFSSQDLDENQTEINSYGVLAYQKQVRDFSLQLASYVRDSRTIFEPDPQGDLIFNGIASEVVRDELSTGLQLDSTVPVRPDHTLRVGAAFQYEQSVTDSSDSVFPADAQGNQTGDVPFTIDDDEDQKGRIFSVYAQDEWRLDPVWTVNGGARFDDCYEYVHESQVSPRLNMVGTLKSGTTVHVGYARYFTPPPLEGVQSSTIDKFNNTTGALPVTTNDPLRAERANYFDVGATQTVTAHAQVGLDSYYKQEKNVLDEGQFGQSLIFTPFNYQKGDIYGVEFTSSVDFDPLSGYVNLAYSHATATNIDSAQYNFAPDELSYISTHTIYVDHNQTWTSSAGAVYAITARTKLLVDALYGSGLRSGFANTSVMPWYYTVNLGAETTWQSWKARIDITNILDRVYELRNGTGVGVGAPQYGARRGFYGGLTYSF